MKKEITKDIKKIAKYYKVSLKNIPQLISMIKKGHKEADKIVNDQILKLRAMGIINSKKEEDELLLFAIKHKITNLYQATLLKFL